MFGSFLFLWFPTLAQSPSSWWLLTAWGCWYSHSAHTPPSASPFSPTDHSISQQEGKKCCPLQCRGSSLQPEDFLTQPWDGAECWQGPGAQCKRVNAWIARGGLDFWCSKSNGGGGEDPKLGRKKVGREQCLQKTERSNGAIMAGEEQWHKPWKRTGEQCPEQAGSKWTVQSTLVPFGSWSSW